MKQGTETTAKAQCESLAEEHFPDGLIRMLEAQFPTARFQDLEDAAAYGFVRLLAKGEALEAPARYITAVAFNYMKRLFVRDAREVLPASGVADADPEDWADPTAEQVVDAATFAFVRGVVENWQSLNVRSATLLVLEAVELDEPISSAELAEEMESLLGEDVLPDTARQWRKRGLDRLRKELHELDEVDKER